VSGSIFGEHYFSTRERLTNVMRGVTQLAAETHKDLGENPVLADVESKLNAPFLFVVCGEVNSGKSTLINSLFGREICRVNILPETDRIIRYQYGSVPRSLEVMHAFEERHLPMNFLKDFTLVDTPGTNSNITGHEEILAELLEFSELVLCVFPVTNPWGGPTWNLLSTLSAESLKRVVIVLQQADQRDAADIKVTLGHLADLAMKRLGVVPPIFAVSGKLAFDAKRAFPNARDRLRASGFVDLERYISNSICESPERKSFLEAYRWQVASRLHSVESHIDDQAHALKMQGRFLDRVENEIDGIRERFVLRLTGHLTGVTDVFEKEAVWGSQLLRKRLGVLSSFVRLFTGDRTGPIVEAAFIKRLQRAIVVVAEKDGAEVVEFCRRHWADLGERVKAEMSVDLGKSDQLDVMLAEAKEQFVNRLSSAAREGIGNLKVRNQLDRDLRRRNVALKSFTFMTLVLTIIGSTCGALGVPWIPFILCGLAILFLTGGILVATLTRKNITQDFQQSLLSTCGSFAATLRTDYEEALRIVFQDYALSLTAVRTYLANEKQAVEPRQRRWKELFLTLKAIEQEL
jgi:energy-coupling factor transporter ATP-binding protein EcfA2